MKIFYFSVFIFLASCDSHQDNESEIESMRGEVASDIVDESSVVNEINEEYLWSAYEGRIGTYEQQVVLEIGILNDEVTGRYFYARHQNFLALEGSYDSLKQEFNLIETFRGKITGYIRCWLDEEGNLDGSWSKQEDGDSELFKAKRLTLGSGDQKRLDVDFLKYNHRHKIQIYSGMSNESDIEYVIDEMMISQLDETYFSFYYSIIGGNGHTGSIDGIGIMNTSDSADFIAPHSGCILGFVFEADSLFIYEKEDCSFYRGMRAHFTNKLGKIEKGLIF